MAKRGRRRGVAGTSGAGERVEAFAEDLGRLLGTARAKAEGWLGQRTEIAKQLTVIRDTAAQLLSDLGHQAQTALRRRGRPPRAASGMIAVASDTGAPVAGPGRRRRRRISAEARARMAAAQKARWARYRKEREK